MTGTTVTCENVTYCYEGEEIPAIKEITFMIPAGQWTAVIGTSGSGKSTLCQLLNGLLPRSGGGIREGRLQLDGMDPADAPLAEVTGAVGVLFQDPDAQLVQGIVEDEVAFGPENMTVHPEEIEQRIAESLEAVGLTERRRDHVRTLSGGQRQRTAIAAVLALQPRLFVFDDACASLDAAAQADFLQLCRALQGKGRTVITASGRFDDAARAAQRVIVLDGGTVVLDGPPEALLRRCGEQLAELGLLPPLRGEAAAIQPAPATAGVLGAPPAAATAASPRVLPPSAVSPAPSGTLLTVKSLDFTYPGGRQPLRDVHFKLRSGEWALLTGANGSGKTTLSRLLMGLLSVPKGRIMWQGEDIAGVPVYRMAERIGYVFQQPEHTFTAANVWEEITYSLHGGLPPARRPELTAEEKERADYLLHTAGLHNRLGVSPYLLSRGEKRLLSVISQLIVPKDLYILDEPTSGMDYAGIGRLIRLCRAACRRGSALLMITHDPELVEAESDLLLNLQEGKMMSVLLAAEPL